jgi:uncharacterized protein YyaL (SSP411 family)
MLEFLLEHAYTNKDTDLLAMIKHSLSAMAQGGIFDHVGGGFCRYSTDARWLIPHFEKMLYDNAFLLRAYVLAFKLTGEHKFRLVAEKICSYLTRDLRHDRGGFFSAEDADSEGSEGRFYVYTHDEFVRLADGLDSSLLAKFYGISESGNFSERQNVLATDCSVEQFCARHELEVEVFRGQLDEMESRLFAYRSLRTRPALDDKIIASWNGLAIGAMARAGRILKRSDYIEVAVRAAEFVGAELIDDKRRLRRCWRGKVSGINGFFEDYAFVVHGLLELYRGEYAIKWLQLALELHEAAGRMFADSQPGEYFEIPADGEKLFFRPKNTVDGAMPSATAVFAANCVTLAAITGKQDFIDQATAIFAAAADQMSRFPASSSFLLKALMAYYENLPRFEIIADRFEDIEAVLVAIDNSIFAESPLIVCFDKNQAAQYSEMIPGFSVDEKRCLEIRICQKFSCISPVYSIEEFTSALRKMAEAAMLL